MAAEVGLQEAMQEAGGATQAPGSLLGVDFTSAPRPAKPIVIAHGRPLADGHVELLRLERLVSLQAWQRWLAQPRPWLGGFDLPMGLPRELVEFLGWPLDWAACMRHYGQQGRAPLRETFVAFCAGRPAGRKFAHRTTDGPAGSSPSMKWVNPPVAWMMHAAVPSMIEAGIAFPAHAHAGREGADKVALEAYPAIVARSFVGRASYKSDDPKRRDDVPRREARQAMVKGIAEAGWRGMRLRLDPAQAEMLVADAQGDALDAALCLLMAAWARTQPDLGLPPVRDPLEGWIVGA